MDNIQNVNVRRSSGSKYIELRKIFFNQNGKERTWDVIKSHDSVSVLIHHIERQTFIFVKQFRPAVLVSQAITDGQDVLNSPVDLNRSRPELAYTLELCAGIVDKKCSLEEIARQEVLEECGYDVPVSSLERIIQTRGSVGFSGSLMTMFYVEVTEAMKKHKGGGNPEEGESIEVVEMPVENCLARLQSQNDVPEEKSLGLIHAVMWYNFVKK